MGFFNNFSGKAGDMPLPTNMPPPPVPKKREQTIPVIQPAQAMPLPMMPSKPIEFKPIAQPTDMAIAKTEIKIEKADNIQTSNWMEQPQDKFNLDIPEELPELNLPIPEPSYMFYNEFDDIPSFELGSFDEPRNVLPGMLPTTELLELKKQGPLFIRTDDYSQIISNIDTVSGYIHESPGIIYTLNNIKRNMDQEQKNFSKVLEDIQRKFIYIDNLMFESMKEGKE